MSELRWNPVRGEWVVTATHRQERPHLRKDWCPFCPSSGLVPADYDVMIYPNDFPSFSLPPPEPAIASAGLFRTAPAEGICEVVVYHPDHHLSFAQLPVLHVEKIVRLWSRRFRELSVRKEIAYVFIFENKGEVIGVTIPHPHGQIYAFSYVPPVLLQELSASEKHFQAHGTCLFCDLSAEEERAGARMVCTNESFVAYIPFFARYPYEVHVLSRRHVGDLTAFDDEEIRRFAAILKDVTMRYDGLFEFSFPYMMVLHQSPTDGASYPHYHFHVEFYPPYRSRDKLKYLAGCESGAGTFINDTLAEEKAAELRSVNVRF